MRNSQVVWRNFIATQQKKKVIYTTRRNSLKLGFSSAALETIRLSNTRYKLLRKKDCDPILDSAELLFNYPS